MLLNIFQCTGNPHHKDISGLNKTIVVCKSRNSALVIFSNTNQIITVMTKEKEYHQKKRICLEKSQMIVKKLFSFPPEITQRSFHCQMN